MVAFCEEIKPHLVQEDMNGRQESSLLFTSMWTAQTRILWMLFISASNV